MFVENVLIHLRTSLRQVPFYVSVLEYELRSFCCDGYLGNPNDDCIGMNYVIATISMYVCTYITYINLYMVQITGNNSTFAGNLQATHVS